MSPINLDRLPGALRDLVHALGEPAAFRLVERRGGGRLVVPKKVHPDHSLMDELGLKIFADLVAAYGGEVLDLPKHDSVVRQIRHQRVRRLRAEGITMDRIAVATGYTRRQVINILGADVDRMFDERQADLFATERAPVLVSDNVEEPRTVRANDPFGIGRRRTG